MVIYTQDGNVTPTPVGDILKAGGADAVSDTLSAMVCTPEQQQKVAQPIAIQFAINCAYRACEYVFDPVHGDIQLANGKTSRQGYKQTLVAALLLAQQVVDNPTLGGADKIDDALRNIVELPQVPRSCDNILYATAAVKCTLMVINCWLEANNINFWLKAVHATGNARTAFAPAVDANELAQMLEKA